MPQIAYYLHDDETCPFNEWFGGLAAAAAVKVTRAIRRLEAGNDSSVKWFGGIGEYKIDWGPGYRLYLAKDGDELVLLLVGGTKQTQTRDIEVAKAYFSNHKKRKKPQGKSAGKARTASKRGAHKAVKE
jgi:putative addiction module killer protein